MSTNMSQKKDNIEWRRNKVQELLVKGYNHYEIATILQISRPTITRETNITYSIIGKLLYIASVDMQHILKLSVKDCNK